MRCNKPNYIYLFGIFIAQKCVLAKELITMTNTIIVR